MVSHVPRDTCPECGRLLDDTVVEWAGIALNHSALRVTHEGVEHRLSPRQAGILGCVLRCRGRPAPTHMIEDAVYGDNELPISFDIAKNISVHICEIGRKTGIRMRQLSGLGVILAADAAPPRGGRP